MVLGKCYACHEQVKERYCGHCINTSPHLILKHRIELYEIQASNNELRAQVDEILKHAMDESSEPKDVLGRNLAMLKTAHLKRKINKFRRKVEQARDAVQLKSDRVKHLQDQLNKNDADEVDNSRMLQDSGSNQKAQFQALEPGLRQLQKVLANSKALKFQELVRLFRVRRREHPKFPYTISFQPMVNIQHLYCLPQNVIECSLRSMWEFLILAGKVLLVELPLKEAGTDVLNSLTGIVLNLLVFLRSLDLVPGDCSDKRALLRSLLRTYDVDKLFYCMIINEDVNTDIRSNAETAISYEVCHSELQALLQGSGELSVLNNSVDDKWFLVG
ncbi:LAME_0E06392g1_1 [Lachancea meyersii CBS 8951]|uniref:Autophagy-related protein 14 n=1 Tax=Lachancea meyersii CBS 8951 TaxID=1266667 RepID=A0A1G4JHT6_9SACH|nr:LAME_0E06392g1_1 [Lachancea meyersii CBS 8951]